jgi:hypothetical protein
MHTRAWMMPELLAAAQRERPATIRALMAAVARVVAEIDPDGKRDHRSHWDATLAARRTKPDFFDALRFASDELIVLAVEMTHTDDLAIFAALVDREVDPLGRLERAVPAIQLQRRWFADLRGADLPVAVKAMRRQHDVAVVAVQLLSSLAA